MEATQSQDSSSRNKKIILTSIIYYCTFALGITNNMLGPAVIDFSKKFNTDVDGVSIVFTILTVASLVGAFAFGFFSKFVPRLLLVLTFLLAINVVQFIIPFLSSITVFFLVNAVAGFGSGGYDCSQVAWIIDIWRGEASVWILGQHFMYSLGTALPAFLLAPFLNGEEEDQLTTTTLESTSKTIPPEPFKSQLAVPFIVAGILGVIGIVMQIILGFKSKSSQNLNLESHASQACLVEDEENIRSVSEDPTIAKIQAPAALNLNNSLAYTILLTALSCCVLGGYQGMEYTTFAFLPTFSVYSEVSLTERQGARVLSGMTIAYSVCRFIGIFIGLRIKPQFILLANFVLIIAGNFVFLFGGGSDETLLWAGSILMGAGMSTLYPAYYAYIEKYLYVTNQIAATVTVSGGAVAAIYPLIIGNKIKNSPWILIYVNFVSIVLFVTAFVIVFWITKIRKPTTKPNND